MCSLQNRIFVLLFKTLKSKSWSPRLLDCPDWVPDNAQTKINQYKEWYQIINKVNMKELKNLLNERINLIIQTFRLTKTAKTTTICILV